MTKRLGSCLCGQVKYEVKGEPIRVGICHCANCRRESGSAFTFYAVWTRDDFHATGETTLAHNGQRFCTRCGSRMFAYDEDEAEVQLGTLSDAPTKLVPTYELWVKRREPWLAPVPGAEQHWEDRHTRRADDESA
ncbi:GFA family protein [Ensifer sp. 4252]|uniref:GFA family protein n=1 Tax=Ensifer sp. 4252 TaxID=3373915 RepID=UPI003D1D95C5